VSEGSNGAAGVSTLDSPKPAVQIDNQTDPFSTIVSVQYGDRLGELLDTVRRRFPPRACLAVRARARLTLHMVWFSVPEAAVAVVCDRDCCSASEPSFITA